MRSAKWRRFAVALKLYGISIGSMFFQDDCISRYLFGSYVPDGICICSLRATRYLYYCPLDYFTFTRISGPSSRQVIFTERHNCASCVFFYIRKSIHCAEAIIRVYLPHCIVDRCIPRISIKRDLNAMELTMRQK